MINQEHKKKIQLGSHAIENNGTLEELEETMHECFPDMNYGKGVMQRDCGNMKYYYVLAVGGPVHASGETTLSTIKVTDFFLKEEKDKPTFEDVTKGISKMLEAKDAAYGSCALKPLEIFSKHHVYGARLDEKLARVKHSKELRKNDVADLIGGLILICKDKGWSDFTDLID